jgi:hypothetical protein
VDTVAVLALVALELGLVVAVPDVTAPGGFFLLGRRFGCGGCVDDTVVVVVAAAAAADDDDDDGGGIDVDDEDAIIITWPDFIVLCGCTTGSTGSYEWIIVKLCGSG